MGRTRKIVLRSRRRPWESLVVTKYSLSMNNPSFLVRRRVMAIVVPFQRLRYNYQVLCSFHNQTISIREQFVMAEHGHHVRGRRKKPNNRRETIVSYVRITIDFKQQDRSMNAISPFLSPSYIFIYVCLINNYVLHWNFLIRSRPV